MLTLRQSTHVRFEPDVDGGTTYAFSFRVGELVVGRQSMWELVQAVESGERGISDLVEMLVCDDMDSAHYYPSIAELMADLTLLVDAGVLAVEQAGS